MDTMVIEDERKNQLPDKGRVKRAEEEEENLNNTVSKRQSNISRWGVVKNRLS